MGKKSKKKWGQSHDAVFGGGSKTSGGGGGGGSIGNRGGVWEGPCVHMTMAVPDPHAIKALVNKTAKLVKNAPVGSPRPVWVCVACGNIGVALNTEERGGREHLSRGGRKAHMVGINLITGSIYCFGCKDDVDPSLIAHGTGTICRKLARCLEHMGKVIKLTTKNPASAAATAVRTSTSTSSRSRSRSPRAGSVSPRAPSSSSSSAAAAAAAAAAASGDRSALVSSGSLRDAPAKGLSNLGNTCFFNSTLQALSETLPLISVCPGGAGLPLRRALGDFFDQMNSKSNVAMTPPTPVRGGRRQRKKNKQQQGRVGVVTPRRLLDQVARINPFFKGRRQQDAHELLRTLVGGMWGEIEEQERKSRKSRALKIIGEWSLADVGEWVSQLPLSNPELQLECVLASGSEEALGAEDAGEPMDGNFLVDLIVNWKAKRSKLMRARFGLGPIEDRRAFTRGISQLISGQCKFLLSWMKTRGLSFRSKDNNLSPEAAEGDEKKNDDEAAETEESPSFVHDVFACKLQNTVECLVCHTPSITDDYVFDISLPIAPPPSRKLSSSRSLKSRTRGRGNKPLSSAQKKKAEQKRLREARAARKRAHKAGSPTPAEVSSAATSSKSPANEEGSAVAAAAAAAAAAAPAAAPAAGAAPEDATPEEAQVASESTEPSKPAAPPVKLTPEEAAAKREKEARLRELARHKKRVAELLSQEGPTGIKRLTGEVTLEDCLAAFTDPDILDGADKYGCQSCTDLLAENEREAIIAKQAALEKQREEEEASLRLAAQMQAEEDGEGDGMDDEVERKEDDETESAPVEDGEDGPESDGDNDHDSAFGSDDENKEEHQESPDEQDSTESAATPSKSAPDGSAPETPATPATPAEAQEAEEPDFSLMLENLKPPPLVKCRAYKRFLLQSTPRILTLHLKRFMHTMSGRLQKCTKEVVFGWRLNLAPFCINGGKGLKTHYRLYAVVVHSGGMAGGHYVAYARKRRLILKASSDEQEGFSQDDSQDDDDQGWHYFSDSSHRPVLGSQVLRSQAYILFYERLP